MRLGGSTREPDEDVPVVLVDDRGVPPTITTAEVELGRPRRPVREIVLAVVAVAVVAGVGLLGGGGGDEGEEAGRSPATTERRGPRTETAEQWRSTSSTTVVSERPTTTALGRFEGSGPLLPGDATGTTIGFVDSAGVATIVELDTGSRCTVDVGQSDMWSPWSTRELPSLWVQGDSDLIEVDRACTVTRHENGFLRGWPLALTGRTVWVVDDHEQAAIERNLDTNEATGRSIPIPTYAGANAVVVGDSLVIGAMGDMTRVDVDSGQRASLGAGTPLVGRPGMLVYTACPELECHIGTLDPDTGDRERVVDIGAVPWDSPALSPDGRYLRVSQIEDANLGRPASTIIDLQEHRVVANTDLESAVFTADGRWLVGLRAGDLTAVSVEDPSTSVDLEVTGHSVRQLALLTNP